jgi:signal transduction histidine kinase
MLQLLVIEDAELDYRLLVATLAQQGVPCESRRVESAAQLHEALRERAWDLVISDHCLPGFSSSEAFEIVRSRPEPPPFIIVSGVIGEELAVEAMRRGVDDYLIKGRLLRLGAAVRNALAVGAARREKAQALAQLAESQRELRALSAQLQSRIDQERAAIAREIHDDIGGTLTAVRFDLELAQFEAGEAAAERIRRALGELNGAAQAAQRIMRNLHPAILDAGLAAALRWLVQQFGERHGLTVDFRCNADDAAVAPETAIAVYRACQESLTNVSKHAGATRVALDLHLGPECLSVEIEDDGRGFDVTARARAGALGLRGMAERVRALGGQLDVSSAPGRTTLMLWIPLTEHAQVPA